MGVWLGPMGGGKISGQGDINFTGVSNFAIDANSNWELLLKSNGTLRFLKNPGDVDVFYVGGGFPGGLGTANNIQANGGQGGLGGKTHTIQSTLKKGQNYIIQIGAGGYYTGNTLTNPTASTAFGESSANGSDGSNGGQGSITRSNSRYQAAAKGNDGVFAFNENTSLLNSGVRYAAGGGGAQSMYEYTFNKDGNRAGGTTGGGIGGRISARNDTENGGNGVDNTGSGGGGAWAAYTNTYQEEVGRPGIGGSGIIIIRNHRS